jgi:hypothetical protein
MKGTYCMPQMLPIRRLIYELSSSRPLKLHSTLPSVTIRGAFGYSLLQILARDVTIPHLKEKAEIYRALLYPDLMEGKSSHHHSPARPFVIRGWFSREDKKALIFEVLLFGRSTDAEILIDNVMNNLAFMGIGYENQSCRFLKIHAESVTPAIPDLSGRIVRMNMMTPTRVKCKGEYFRDTLPFENLVLRLHDRFSELVRTYADFEAEPISAGLKEIAHTVESVPVDVEWIESSRSSTRTREECDLSGMVGSIIYSGTLEPFAPLLAVLPWIHVGNSTAFGCGWMDMENAFCVP